MKIREDSLLDWTEQEKKLLADESTGQQFHEYFVFWVSAAEKLLEEDTTGGLSPIGSIREALLLAENTIGNMHIQFLGQMLVYIISYWELGERVANELTAIELKLVHATLQEDQIRKSEEARQGS